MRPLFEVQSKLNHYVIGCTKANVRKRIIVLSKKSCLGIITFLIHGKFKNIMFFCISTYHNVHCCIAVSVQNNKLWNAVLWKEVKKLEKRRKNLPNKILSAQFWPGFGGTNCGLLTLMQYFWKQKTKKLEKWRKNA